MLERLTPEHGWKNACYDTWEICGLDNVCKRDCWKPTPCPIPKMLLRLAEYEDRGLYPDDIVKLKRLYGEAFFKLREAFFKLRAYEKSGLSPDEAQKLGKAKKEGMLVVLLCKIGDTVYNQDGELFKIYHISIWASDLNPDIKIRYHAAPLNEASEYDDIDFWHDDIGKTVFLTREEAEKVLREAGEDA